MNLILNKNSEDIEILKFYLTHDTIKAIKLLKAGFMEYLLKEY